MMTISTGFCGFQPSASAVVTLPATIVADAVIARTTRRVNVYAM
jgi:hypothetical protein